MACCSSAILAICYYSKCALFFSKLRSLCAVAPFYISYYFIAELSEVEERLVVVQRQRSNNNKLFLFSLPGVWAQQQLGGII